MRPKVFLTLLLLCAAALGLRLHGLDFLLPHRMEPDGEIVAQVRLLDAKDRSADWQFGTYGLLIAYVASALPDPATPSPEMSLEQHLAISKAEVLRVRLVVACLSILLIPATYLRARQALGPGPSLFAASLGTTSLLALSLGQQARPHAVATGFYLLSVLASLRLRRSPTWGSYALAGLAAGLAIGVLQSGIAVLIPLAAAHLLREGGSRSASLRRALLASAIVAALLALFYPFLFSQTTSSLQVDDAAGGIRQSGHVIDLARFNGGGFRSVLWAFWSYEPVILLLGLAGLPVVLRRLAPLGRSARRDLIVVLAFALPYLCVVGIFQGTQERFLLPLIPYAAVLGAFVPDALLRRAGEDAPRRALAVASALLLLAFPSYVAWRLSAARAADDTLEQAAAWIEAHCDPREDRVLATFPGQLPLFHDDETAASSRMLIPDRSDFYPILTRWVRYELYRSGVAGTSGPQAPRRWKLLTATPGEFDPQRASQPAHDRLRELGVDYTVVELFPPERGVPGEGRRAEVLRSIGTRQARLAPWRDPGSSDLGFEYEGMPSHPDAYVVGYVLAARSVGPVVEIYSVGEAK